MLRATTRRRESRRQVRRMLAVVPPRLRLRDLAAESALSILRHPGRSLVTAIGTVLGAAAFVSTMGLSSTIQHQVSDSFDLRRATEVIVRPESAGLDPRWQTESGLRRLRGLNGVAGAGRRVSVGERQLARSVGGASRPVPVLGADPHALAVMQPRTVTGRAFDQFHEDRAARVVMLSHSAAEALQIGRVGSAIFVDRQAFTVIGIFDDVARRPEALMGIMMPAAAAERLVVPGGRVERDVVIATAPGAAQLVGGQATLALWPADPAALRAIAPPDPRTLRREIEGNLTRSTLVLSLVTLVMGVFAIGNAATAAISARIPEIGLRRAIGARPGHIFAQLVAETTAVGGAGAALGALAGVVVTAGVSLANGWVPVTDLRTALLATAAGAAGGTLAGLFPAIRATRIQPVAALKR